ncbi:MAG: hypothetical protein N2C14_17255 [Planctomycetales bacterium]
MTSFRRPCDCCGGIGTIDACRACCLENTLPDELLVSVPAGWTDGTECDACDAMTGDWYVPLLSSVAPEGLCFFGDCARWRLTHEDWCEMQSCPSFGECPPGPCEPIGVFYDFQIEVNLKCPVGGECELFAYVGVGRSTSDGDPCPRRSFQDYTLQRVSIPEDCSAWSGLILAKDGALDGWTEICDNPPLTITISAA